MFALVVRGREGKLRPEAVVGRVGAVVGSVGVLSVLVPLVDEGSVGRDSEAPEVLRAGSEGD